MRMKTQRQRKGECRLSNIFNGFHLVTQCVRFRYDRFKNSVSDSSEAGAKVDGIEEIGKTATDNSEVVSTATNGNADK